MSASRRLLGLRNASFAPQLGIKGLVSELLFHAIAKNRPTKRKWTLHVTVRALFHFHVKSQIHATEMWIIWIFRQSGFREALKLEIRSELLLIPNIGLILRCRFNDKQSSIKNVSLDILLVAWQRYICFIRNFYDLFAFLGYHAVLTFCRISILKTSLFWLGSLSSCIFLNKAPLTGH